MSDWMEILRIALKVLFWGVLPIAIIYARYKQKLATSFAIGSILTCLIFGLLSVATVEEDPVIKFMTSINEKDYNNSNKNFKILVQYGPEYLEKIDTNEIIDLEFFEKVKKDIIREYQEIASRYNETEPVVKITECKNLVREERKLHKLKHAKMLLTYAGYLNYKNKKLNASLDEKIGISEKLMVENEKVCH